MIGDGGVEDSTRRDGVAVKLHDGDAIVARRAIQIYIYTRTCIAHTSIQTHTCTRERRRSSRSLACAEPRTAAVQLQLCVQAGNAGGGMEAAWWAHSLPGPSILHLRLSRSISPPFSLSFSPSLLASRSPFSPRVSPFPE